MKEILFGIGLCVINFVMIFVSKFIMYKLFKCKSYRKNLYFSTTILTAFSYIIFILLTYIVSLGNRFELSSNLSSFSLIYLISLLLSVVINCTFENIIYKNNKYIYKEEKVKKISKKS